MSTLGRAVIEFSADTARFQGDVGRAEVVFGRAMSKMQAGIANLRNLALAAAGAGGILAMVKSSIDTADQLGKLSQKIGLSVERLSELRFAASLADTNLESFTKGMKGFNQALVEAQDGNSKAAEIFKQLGVDIAAGPDKALRQFADGLALLKDGELKTALATEVLKKGGLELIPMLNQGSKGLDEMADKARKLGLVMSADMAKQAEQFNDSLKTIAARTEALSIALAGRMIGGLAEVSTNMAKAAENGTLWSRSLLEVAKAITVVASLFPKWTEIGKAGDRTAELLFRLDQGAKGREEAGADFFTKYVKPWPSGRRALGGQQPTAAEAMGPPAPNTEALACALSGGKWVNGKCERAGAKKPKDNTAADLARSLEAQQEIMDEANRLGADFLLNQQKVIDEHNNRLQAADIAGWVAHADAVFAAAEEEALALAKIAAQSEKADNIARDLGMTFSSAFEDAIVGAKKFSEVLRSLERDILRLVTRELITKPFAEGITGMVKGSGIGQAVSSFFSSIFGGGKAVGGPVSTGTAYMVGERGPELFVPNMAGQIVPNGASGNIQVTMNVQTPDIGSFRASSGQMISDMFDRVSAARRLR